VLLNQGRIVANGTPADVLTAERIQEVFAVKPTLVPGADAGMHLIFD
jgi:ABC-type cobalamin/Fe3+-siderophores transport system ATPase subunit